MKTSAVIATRNRPFEVSTLLALIFKQTRLPDEVVIVDASDSPVSAPVGTPTPITVLRAVPNVCAQRNAGARAASGDVVFFFDDDVEPSIDFIEVMMRVFESDPGYAAGMGTLAPMTRRWSVGMLFSRIFTLQHEFGDGGYYKSGFPRHPYGTDRFRTTEVLGGGLMAVRRTVMVEEGVTFDDEMPHSQEDSEFSWRLSRGRRLFFQPAAKVLHRPSPIGRMRPEASDRTFMVAYRRMYVRNLKELGWRYALCHAWALCGLFILAASRARFRTILAYLDALRPSAKSQAPGPREE